MSDSQDITQAAAALVAQLAQDYWGANSSGLPAPAVALVPAVSPTTGADALPAAYAFPANITLDRNNGHVATQTTTVTLSLAVEVADISSAFDLLRLFRDTAAHILANAITAAEETGLHIPSADISRTYDPELLRSHGVFFASMDITVISHHTLS